jgi:hypothetical protein
VVKTEKGFFAVVDGQAGDTCESVGRPCFSPCGRHLAFGVKAGGKSTMVLDGKPGEAYENVSPPNFSPDGSRLAYRAFGDKGQFTVVDGKAFGPHFYADTPVWSPDGKRFAFLGKDKADSPRFLVVDGVRREAPGAEGWVLFSPDGKRYACVEKSGDGFRLASEGAEPTGTYERVSFPAFAPDGSGLAFVALKGGQTFVVVRGKSFGPYADAGDLLFSPDGKRFVFKARVLTPEGARGGDGRDAVAVLDGAPGPAFDAVDYLMFSPDGKRFSHGLRYNRGQGIRIDGRALGPYKRVYPPVFSPGGASLAFLADRESAGVVVVVGTREDGPFDAVFDHTLRFDAAGTRLSFVARSGDLLVRRSVPAGPVPSGPAPGAPRLAPGDAFDVEIEIAAESVETVQGEEVPSQEDVRFRYRVRVAPWDAGEGSGFTAACTAAKYHAKDARGREIDFDSANPRGLMHPNGQGFAEFPGMSFDARLDRDGSFPDCPSVVEFAEKAVGNKVALDSKGPHGARIGSLMHGLFAEIVREGFFGLLPPSPGAPPERARTLDMAVFHGFVAELRDKIEGREGGGVRVSFRGPAKPNPATTYVGSIVGDRTTLRLSGSVEGEADFDRANPWPAVGRIRCELKGECEHVGCAEEGSEAPPTTQWPITVTWTAKIRTIRDAGGR